MITVRRIADRNFMGHKDIDVSLPDRGVVAITGSNGSGKSTLIEAVSACLWGRLLRGTKWLPEEEASVRIEASDMGIWRRRRGRIRELVWNNVWPPWPEFPKSPHATETKAQEALNGVIGPFEQWRRSSVFSSSDLATFTRATDAERKRLIETMIGVGVFDNALASCRRDLVVAGGNLAGFQAELAHMTAEFEGWEKQANFIAEGLGVEPPEVVREVFRAKDKDTEETRVEIQDLHREDAALEQKLVLAHKRSEAAKLAYHDAVSLDVCDRCGQALSDSARETLLETATAQIAAEELEIKSAQSERKALKDSLAELSYRYTVLRKEAAKLRQQQQDRAAWESRRQLVEGQRGEVSEQLSKLGNELVDLEDAVDAAAADLEELKAVERVLGLQGVRAHIVARTLSGIEQVANLWVARLFPGVSVELRPDTELKSGKVAEKISLIVDGVGHGDGYDGCSGGERRRLDVALLLALGEVQAGVVGGSYSTIFADEIFDALDYAGREAATRVLEEISQERCVVVISHVPEFVEGLDAAQRLHFEGGAVVEL